MKAVMHFDDGPLEEEQRKQEGDKVDGDNAPWHWLPTTNKPNKDRWCVLDVQTIWRKQKEHSCCWTSTFPEMSKVLF